MPKVLLIPFLAVTFLIMPALAPAALPPGLAASAHAVTNLNSSRSDIYRKKPRNAARATTVKSSKSNTSDRAINLNSSKSNRAINLNSSRSNRY